MVQEETRFCTDTWYRRRHHETEQASQEGNGVRGRDVPDHHDDGDCDWNGVGHTVLVQAVGQGYRGPCLPPACQHRRPDPGHIH